MLQVSVCTANYICMSFDFLCFFFISQFFLCLCVQIRLSNVKKITHIFLLQQILSELHPFCVPVVLADSEKRIPVTLGLPYLLHYKLKVKFNKDRDMTYTDNETNKYL